MSVFSSGENGKEGTFHFRLARLDINVFAEVCQMLVSSLSTLRNPKFSLRVKNLIVAKSYIFILN